MKATGFGPWVTAAALALLAVVGCGDDSKPSTTPAVAAGNAGEPAAEGGTRATGGELGEPGEPAAGRGGVPEESGMAGAAGAPMAEDPCHGVSTLGECVTPSQARTCVAPTGNAEPMLVTTDCRDFEHCVANGRPARCVLNQNACLPSQSECTNSKQLRTCDANGSWHTQVCPGACQSSAIGGFCVSGAQTTTFNGTLLYEQAQVLDTYVDWAKSSIDQPAEGVLVLSGDGNEWLDATLVDENGNYSLEVPTSNSGIEQLAFFLIHPDPTGAIAQFGVFDPDVTSGVVSTDTPLDGPTWSWAVPLAEVSSGETLRITEEQGSGALHIYRRLLQIQRFDAEFYAAEPGTIAAWFHLNTEWDCGACFAPWPTEVVSNPFDSQLFISATARDRSYWSDAVTIHEAGHYTMWSYGVSPNEGGQHCLGQLTAPGQAWSEGWATGFSSILRESSVYWDKQGGSMFWFDIGARFYQDATWQRPQPQRGLLQDIDENEVAAMLWSLAQPGSAGSDATLLGLRQPSVSGAEFKRGYTRHVWDMNNCRRSSYFDTGESAPMFADYLDGLACGNVPAAVLDDATNPEQSYPYPSREPLCSAVAPPPSSAAALPRSASPSPRAFAQAPALGPHQSPVTVALHGPEQVSAGQDVELWAEVEQLAGSQAQVSLSVQLPEGIRLVSGQSSELLPSGNGKLVRRFVIHVDQVPSTDIEAVASTQSMSFGARAQSAYRFGRPEPRFSQPERHEKRLKVGGKDVGRPILLHPEP